MVSGYKRIGIILFITFSILLIPLIAMQFSEEVNWALPDFIIAGILIFITGILIDFTFRKAKNRKNRLFYSVIIMLALLLLWAELAVGIFGSPIAGS